MQGGNRERTLRISFDASMVSLYGLLQTATEKEMQKSSRMDERTVSLKQTDGDGWMKWMDVGDEAVKLS